MFNVSTLLLDNALKSAMRLTNGSISETLWQFAPLSNDRLFQLIDCRKSSMLIDHLLKIHTQPGTHRHTCGVRTSRLSTLSFGSQIARTWIQSITLFVVPLTFHKVVRRHTWGVVKSLVIILLQIFSWFWHWNNFENQLIFGKVKAYKNCAIFGPPCIDSTISHYSHIQHSTFTFAFILTACYLRPSLLSCRIW